MPFVLIAGQQHEVIDVEFSDENFCFVGTRGDHINSNFIQALSRSELVNIQDPAVWITTQTVLKLLHMEVYLRRFGLDWSSFLLTGSCVLWVFHRCPFKDIDLVVSSEALRYVTPGPFPVDRRPKLDFFKDYSLEVVLQQQKPRIVSIEFLGKRLQAIHPIDALFGKMCTSPPEIFNERGLPRIGYVLAQHGREGRDQFLTKCRKAISEWEFPPDNTRALKINANASYKFASQLKLPRLSKAPLAVEYDIWDFLL